MKQKTGKPLTGFYTLRSPSLLGKLHCIRSVEDTGEENNVNLGE